MITNNADPFLEEAVQFAIAHPPCLVVVNTVQALHKATEHLKAHGTVYALSGGVPSKERYRMILDWNSFPENTEVEEGRRFIVITRGIVMAAGFTLQRYAHIASSCYLTDYMERQVRGRFTFCKYVPTEHLIHRPPVQGQLQLVPNLMPAERGWTPKRKRISEED